MNCLCDVILHVLLRILVCFPEHVLIFLNNRANGDILAAALGPLLKPALIQSLAATHLENQLVSQIFAAETLHSHLLILRRFLP